ncbi:MAG: hypothetical protein ABI151_15930 [Chitinophagaceae bacterium]
MDIDKKEENKTSDAVNKPDPATEHTTDPQEHMEGPISSLVNKAADTIKDTGDKDPKTDE